MRNGFHKRATPPFAAARSMRIAAGEEELLANSNQDWIVRAPEQEGGIGTV